MRGLSVILNLDDTSSPVYGYPVKRKNLLLLWFLFLGVPLLWSQGTVSSRGRNFLEKELSRQGIPYEERSLLAQYGGFGTSVHVDLPVKSGGNTDFSPALVIAVPLLSEMNVYTALYFIQLVKDRGPPLPIRLAFLDDPPQSGPSELQDPGPAGLLDLLQRNEELDKPFFIYLDLASQTTQIKAYLGTSTRVAPLAMVQGLPVLAENDKIPFAFGLQYHEAYRMKLVKGSENLELAQNAGYGAVLLQGSGGRTGTPGPKILAPTAVATFLYHYAKSLSQESMERDYHYSIFNLGTSYFFLTEKMTVLWFLIWIGTVLTLVLLYALGNRKIIAPLWMMFFKRFWVILVYFGLLYGSLWSAKFIFPLITQTTGFRGLTPSFTEAALVLLLTLSLYEVGSPVISLLKIPRRAHFYGFAGLLFLFIGTLFAAALDLTFMTDFLWADFFGFFAATIGSAQIALIFLLLAPLRLFAVIGSVVGAGDPTLARWIVSGGPAVSAILTLIILPFLFFIKRISLLLSSRRQSSPVWSVWIPRGILLAGTIATIYSYASNRVERAKPIVLPRVVEVKNPAPRFFNITLGENTFLDRRTLKITLQAIDPPDRFYLSLQSGSEKDNLYIYDAPIPFKLGADGKSLSFVLGQNPPNPLNLELVIPRDFHGTLTASVLFTQTPRELAAVRSLDGRPAYVRLNRTIPVP